VREGAHLAANLARALSGEPLLPFRYASRGSLVPLGCRTAVAKVFGVKLAGFPAYFLWRTYYWLKMPGWSRKFRVALDWTADLIFARDIVQLGFHRPRTKSEE
jgi:NADH dehydrogenase